MCVRVLLCVCACIHACVCMHVCVQEYVLHNGSELGSVPWWGVHVPLLSPLVLSISEESVLLSTDRFHHLQDHERDQSLQSVTKKI